MTNNKTVTVNIVSRLDSSNILFSAEVDVAIEEQFRLCAALVISVGCGADLRGADLRGAEIDDGSKLTGERPIFMLGPIGSESRTFVAYITTSGLRLRTGCFFGTREQFLRKLDDKHGMATTHAREYHAALAMIDAHCELWTPEAATEEAAA